MSYFSRSVAVIVLLAATAHDATPASAAARFDYEDVFHLEQATDPEISPDGRRIVYVRRSMDVMSDRRRSNLWTIRTDGSDHRPLASGLKNYSSPRFSPDGSRILFVSDSEGTTQLYVRWLDGGQTARITDLSATPGGPSWSPDGRWIAFTLFVPERSKSLIDMPSPPEGAEWAEPAREIDSLSYRSDGRGYIEEGYRQVFVVPADGGSPRQLTHGAFDHQGTPVWFPDGKSLLIEARRSAGWQFDPRNTDLFEISLDDGEVRPLTRRHGPDGSPVISPDGARIAYVGNDDDDKSYLQNVLYVMGRNGDDQRPLTAGLDRSVQNPRWADDGRSLLVQFTDQGKISIARVGIDGSIRRLVDDVGGLSLGRPYAGGTFAAHSGSAGFVYTVSSPDRPADLAYATLDGKVTRLTRLNDDLLGHRSLGKVEELRFPSSFDGREITAWIVKPPDFDPAKKYPLILEIHGGPYAAYGPHFAAEVQLMAAEGYVVLYVNPRGSTGNGAEFANLIHQNYPSQDFDDLMSAVDTTVARGYVDEDNLFVTGGSGGGVLSAWIVGKTDRFNATVVAKPVINWTSAALTTDISVLFTRYWMPGLPWETHDEYWRHSPLSLVGNVSTPTMVLTGENDYRTPMSESEQFYQALKLREIDATLVRVPDASHGIASRPSNLIKKVKYVVAWFEKYRVSDPPTRR